MPAIHSKRSVVFDPSIAELQQYTPSDAVPIWNDLSGIVTEHVGSTVSNSHLSVSAPDPTEKDFHRETRQEKLTRLGMAVSEDH